MPGIYAINHDCCCSKMEVGLVHRCSIFRHDYRLRPKNPALEQGGGAIRTTEQVERGYYGLVVAPAVPSSHHVGPHVSCPRPRPKHACRQRRPQRPPHVCNDPCPGEWRHKVHSGTIRVIVVSAKSSWTISASWSRHWWRQRVATPYHWIPPRSNTSPPR